MGDGYSTPWLTALRSVLVQDNAPGKNSPTFLRFLLNAVQAPGARPARPSSHDTTDDATGDARKRSINPTITNATGPTHRTRRIVTCGTWSATARLSRLAEPLPTKQPIRMLQCRSNGISQQNFADGVDTFTRTTRIRA